MTYPESNSNSSRSIPEPSASASYVFVLVHGTFAPDAEWVHSETSMLRTRLTSEFPEASVEFEPFVWTGFLGSRLNNSHIYRVRAARALHKKLIEIHDCDPDARIFILAHSHGGNVSLYALGDSKVKAKVSGAILMATPYFVVGDAAAVSIAYQAWSTLVQFIYFAGGFVIIPLLLALGFVAAVSYYLSPLANSLFTKSLIGIPTLFIALLIIPGTQRIFAWLRNITNSIFAYITAKVRQSARQRLQATLPPKLPVLYLLAQGDEVRSVFKVLHCLLGFLGTTLGKFSWGIATIALIHLTVELLHSSVLAPTHNEFSWAGVAQAPIDYDFAIFLTIALLATISVSVTVYAFVDRALSRLRTLVYGWERFPETLFCSIEAKPTPIGHEHLVGDTRRSIHEIPREYDVKTTLRHSGLYASEAVLDDIVEWIRRVDCPTELPECPACVRIEKDQNKKDSQNSDSPPPKPGGTSNLPNYGIGRTTKGPRVGPLGPRLDV